MGKTVIRVRGGAFDRPELATLSVGRASAQELELVGVPDGVVNVCLENGIVRPAENSQGWWGINVQYESFGPAQALIVPFVDTDF